MLQNCTVDEVLLKRKHRFTHLQNFKMLLAICEKKLAIFASTGNYFRPCSMQSFDNSKAKAFTRAVCGIVSFPSVRASRAGTVLKRIALSLA